MNTPSRQTTLDHRRRSRVLHLTTMPDLDETDVLDYPFPLDDDDAEPTVVLILIDPHILSRDLEDPLPASDYDSPTL